MPFRLTSYTCENLLMDSQSYSKTLFPNNFYGKNRKYRNSDSYHYCPMIILNYILFSISITQLQFTLQKIKRADYQQEKRSTWNAASDKCVRLFGKTENLLARETNEQHRRFKQTKTWDIFRNSLYINTCFDYTKVGEIIHFNCYLT